MILHGLMADAQRRCDLFVAETFYYTVQYFHFPIGEWMKWAAWLAVWVAG